MVCYDKPCYNETPINNKTVVADDLVYIYIPICSIKINQIYTSEYSVFCKIKTLFDRSQRYAENLDDHILKSHETLLKRTDNLPSSL